MYLEFKHLNIGYKHPLTDFPIDIKITAPQLCVLFGNNGCGKTTLIKTIAKLIQPISGKIIFNEKDIFEINNTLFSKQFAFLFISPTFLMNHTVLDIIALGRIPYLEWTGKLTATDKKIIHQYAEILGIEDILLQPAHEISDGQFQKTLIAKILVQQTPVLILDEPLTHLDYGTKIHILNILKNIAQSEKKIILMSSHDIHLCKDMADSIFLIHQKKYLFESSQKILSESIFQNFFIQV